MLSSNILSKAMNITSILITHINKNSALEGSLYINILLDCEAKRKLPEKNQQQKQIKFACNNTLIPCIHMQIYVNICDCVCVINKNLHHDFLCGTGTCHEIGMRGRKASPKVGQRTKSFILLSGRCACACVCVCVFAFVYAL